MKKSLIVLAILIACIACLKMLVPRRPVPRAFRMNGISLGDSKTKVEELLGGAAVRSRIAKHSYYRIGETIIWLEGGQVGGMSGPNIEVVGSGVFNVANVLELMNHLGPPESGSVETNFIVVMFEKQSLSYTRKKKVAFYFLNGDDPNNSVMFADSSFRKEILGNR